MKYRFLILLLGLFFTGTTYAQTFTGPSLHCATTQANGDVVINWTNNTCPCGGLPTDSIFISQSLNGPYSFLVVEPSGSTSYTQTGANGNNVTYYYYMVANCNCPGFTSLHSDTINNRNPQVPGINFVTVNTNGSITINWQQGSSAQTFGYVIYEVVNGLDNPIDTVNGRNDTSLVIPKSNGDTASVSYTIAAIDSCGNIGPFNTSPQHTVYTTYTINTCAQTITLNWDAYQNWPGVQSYSLYDSINGAPATLVATYDNSTYTGTISGITNLENICFWVVVNEQGGGSYSSSSNLQCTTIHSYQPVTYCYIKRITTASNHEVDVTFIFNNSASLQGLIVERSDDNIKFYKLAYTSGTSPYFYADKTVNATLDSFYYRLVTVDSCGDSTFSSSANNIVLSGYAFSTLNNEVQWNAFNFQYGTLLNYSLYRMYGIVPFALVSDTSAPLSFQEDVSSLMQKSTNDQFCYYIIATDSIHYPNGVADTTTCQSNIICLDQGVNILVPTAIVPGGINNVFLPKFINPDIDAFDMQIYNRWGGLIFESNNVNTGWDGTYKGKVVEQGVYAYTITVVDTQQRTTQKAGTVMVIR